MDPLTFATLPCRVVTLEQRAFAVLGTSGSRPVLQFLWVEPAARRRGGTGAADGAGAAVPGYRHFGDGPGNLYAAVCRGGIFTAIAAAV